MKTVPQQKQISTPFDIEGLPLDPVSTFFMLMLTAIGLLFVFSSTYTAEKALSVFFKKQAIGASIGLLFYVGSSLCDYRTIMRWGYFCYMLLIPVLLFTLARGSIGMGAQRWIYLGFFKLQPSELAKFLFPSFAAFYWHASHMVQAHRGTYNTLLLILLVSTVLVIKQPDLGTGLIILFSGLLLFWINGLSHRFFLTCTLILCVCAPGLWRLLKPYQRSRIAVFLGQGTTKKERYQIEQAKIAIGSGGIQGKGFLHGTQNKLLFLPEGRTDFIFAVLCEEWGLIGALLLLLLYVGMYSRLFVRICTLKNHSAKLFALGLLLHLLLSTIINVCMTLGLLPIVGIPLPFMSYGLSNLWISYISLGCIQNIVHHPRAHAPQLTMPLHRFTQQKQVHLSKAIQPKNYGPVAQKDTHERNSLD